MGQNEKMGNKNERKHPMEYDTSGGVSAIQHFFAPGTSSSFPLFSLLNMLFMHFLNTYCYVVTGQLAVK